MGQGVDEAALCPPEIPTIVGLGCATQLTAARVKAVVQGVKAALGYFQSKVLVKVPPVCLPEEGGYILRAPPHALVVDIRHKCPRAGGAPLMEGRQGHLLYVLGTEGVVGGRGRG